MTGENDPTDGATPLLTIPRRRLLKAAGVGLAATSVGGVGTVSAHEQQPYTGPFHRTYEGKTVTPGGIEPITTDDPYTLPGGEGSEGGSSIARGGEEDEEEMEVVPRKSPSATGKATGSGGSVQTKATEGDIVGGSFDGLGADDARGVVPSDNQIAVGDGYLVNAINSRLAVFDTDGNLEFQFTLDDWWQNVSTIIYEQEAEEDGSSADFFGDYIIFDPRARYDASADRFILVCVEYSLNTGIGAFLLSVSDSGDPTGSWTNYRIQPVVRDGEENQPGLVDFPLLGYDEHAIYLAQNFFDPGFSGATMVAIDKSAAYDGDTVDANHFTQLLNPDGSLAFTVQPVAGEGSGTGYFVNSRFFQGQTLTVWEMENGFGEDPTLENDAVRVRPYHNAPAANQPDTEEKIDPIDTRIQRVAFDGSNLWATHTINDGRIRWYHIDPDTEGGPSILHSGNFKRHGRSTYMPAIEADSEENVAIVYNSSSANGNDGYVGAEVATVDADEIDEFEVYAEGHNDYDYQDGEAGEADNGPQVMRWGDYNGIEIAPDGTFWFTSQYTPEPPEGAEYLADNFYATRIGHIHFD